jgi:hypothetical protein
VGDAPVVIYSSVLQYLEIVPDGMIHLEIERRGDLLSEENPDSY